MNSRLSLFGYIVLLSVVGNIIFAFLDGNFSGTIGWAVALCWFPWKLLVRNSKPKRTGGKDE